MASKKNAPVKTKSDILKREKRRQEDSMFYKMLVAFAVAIVIEFALVLLYRKYYAGANYHQALRIVQWALLAVTAALAVTFWVGVLRKNPRLSKIVFVIGAICFAVAVQIRLINISNSILAIKVGCILWPVILLLYIIQLIYQPEFFVTALCCAGGIFAVWDAKKIFYLEYYSRMNVTIVIGAMLVLLAAVTFIAMKRNGAFFKGDWQLRLFGPKTNYKVMYITYAATALLIILYFLFEITLYLPVIIAFAAYAFVAAIYYTTKLM